ncbi:MAG: STAS domain-containing protein [Candidatus Omnitrophica bacterium]|nr:STAS domain-containing protein [Candidatus Omnitrophota bacterium]
MTWPHVKQFQNEMGRVLQSGVRVLELDLAGLSYLDSAGLAAFLPVHQLFTNAGGRMRIVNTRKFIRHLFVSSHLDTVLEFAVEERSPV